MICEVGAYLQDYIHFLTTRGRLKVVGTIQLLNGDKMGRTWEELQL